MSQQKAYVEKWINYLNDVDHEMSLLAAQKLGNVRDKSIVQELVKSLVKRPDDVRVAAARSLGEIGDKSAVPALVKLLADRNSLVASTAADSLGMIGDPSAVPALVKVLEGYRSDKARYDQIRGFDRGLYAAVVNALQQFNTFEARIALKKYNR